jgi:methionyl-tRNA formyltransferase
MKIVFFGSPDFAVPSLAAVAAHWDVALVVAQPDRPAGRGQKVHAPAVKTWAEAHGMAVAQPQRLKGDEGLSFIEELRAIQPDVFVVAAYGKILPQALLDVPRLGPFNVHGSLLPKYRGAAPIQWSVINGDVETGVTIMRMEAGLDTGPIVSVRSRPIGDNETAGQLFDQLAKLGADLLVDTLREIEAGRANMSPQDHAQATLAPMLTKEMGHLDFSKSARLVSAQARGVDPWPGAYALLSGEAVKLFGPTFVDGSAPPGTVIAADKRGLHIACGQGALSFAEIQLPGRKRLGVEAVIAGRGIREGAVFA